MTRTVEEKRAAQKIARQKYQSSPKGKALQRKHDASPRRKASRHGIDVETLSVLRNHQTGCCAICRETLMPGRGTHLDHDHGCCPKNLSCGNCVRGLLCNKCNTSLGVFKDDPVLLRRAAEYLETSNWNWRLS